MDEDIIFITAEESGERIDALLSRNMENLSRSAAARLLEEGHVLLGGRPVKKNYKCKSGEAFEVTLPEPEDSELVPQDIPLDIIYEDDDLIVINKHRGMVVHPAPGHSDGTLVNALMFHCGDSLSGIGGQKRPGIVHRIDKDTSGLLVAAKNDSAHAFLSAQLADRSLSREYCAVVRGRMKDISGTIDLPIGRSPSDRKKMAVVYKNSRNAVTHWFLEEQFREYSLLKCVLETGRTHQIRVHMAAIGHPLLGDGLYGAPCPEKGLEGQCLHAMKIKFIHPSTKEPLQFEAPLPEYFNEVIKKLGPPERSEYYNE